ncbi:hypothetical protein PENTCL1PPCAC_13952, partial [Pristionchus entomophagus]
GNLMVVERDDSDLLGDLLLEDVDLSLDVRGKGVLDLSGLLELLLGGLVGDEDLDDLSEGLLGRGGEGGDLGAGLIGVGLKNTYLDVGGELLESLEDLVEGEDANLVGDLSQVLVDLGLDFGGKGSLQLLILLEDDLSVLSGNEVLDEVSGGLLGGGRELGNSGAGLIGVVLQWGLHTVSIYNVIPYLSDDVGGKGLLDLAALVELLLGGLVGDEDLDHLSEGLLGSGGESGDLGAGLIGVSLKDYGTYLDVVGELLESLDDLAQGEESDLVGQLGDMVIDLSLDGGREGSSQLVVLLEDDLGVLSRHEVLDEISGGLLSGGRELGDSGAGLIGLLESLEDLIEGEDANLVGDLSQDKTILYLDVLGESPQLEEVVVVAGGVVSDVVERHDSDLDGELLLEGGDLHAYCGCIRFQSIMLYRTSPTTSEGRDSLILRHSSNFSLGDLSETKILTISPKGFWAAGDRVATLARASSGRSHPP